MLTPQDKIKFIKTSLYINIIYYIDMARRKLTNKLINIRDINEQLVLISESNKDYITPSGKIYTYYGTDTPFPIIRL